MVDNGIHMDILDIPSGNDYEFASLNMAIEIVSFPRKNGDFPYSCKCLPQRVGKF